MANAEAIPDLAAFQEMVQVLKEAFPSSTAPYRDFIQVRARYKRLAGSLWETGVFLQSRLIMIV